ncbi:MAG: YheT family hydrolase [Thermoanaerobaculia bacterium]
MSLRVPRQKVSPPAGPEGGVYPAEEDFRPAWWLPWPHAQTVWRRLAGRRRPEPYAREVLETPDGDELVVDRLEGPAGSPILVILHGLEGSSFSIYVQDLLRLARERGWRGAALNFRSCARDPGRPGRMLPNRRPRLYHSGETGDLGFLLSTLAGREPEAPLFAAGVSLGGNVLLKWLGENPKQTVVRAAAAISTPYDLAEAARHLEKGLGRLYTGGLLRTLRAKALELARRFPGVPIDAARARGARTFWEFDDAVTAPLHGFSGALDYYTRSSSLRFLQLIETPTLCLSARDDPFLPAEVLDRARRAASRAVRLAVTARGGHAGFVTSRGANFGVRHVFVYYSSQCAPRGSSSPAPSTT